MKFKPWIHSALHIGCVALLLLQGHRIQKLQMTVAKDGLRIQKLQMEVAEDALRYEQWRPASGCVAREDAQRLAASRFAEENIWALATLQEHFEHCMQSKADSKQ